MCHISERCVEKDNSLIDCNCNVVDESNNKSHSHLRNMKEEKGKTRFCSLVMRYFSAVTILTTVMYMAFCPLSKGDNSLTTVVFLHLLSFAAHFGAQFWVTFVAGFTMFFNLPRILFGRVQSRLFPLYFGTTLVLSCVTFVTFSIRHPYEAMTSKESKQLVLLGICVASTFFNSYFVAPQIVNSMINVFEMEEASGIAYAIGYCDRTELKKDPQYLKYYKQFRLCHSVSGVANILTLVCNLVYLYYMASLS